ncbi:hypothetical protein JW960_23800 [candidate division KSB1 bacterium]|nr:hypothetical protein [candidate division KSB1 bacterium]
MKQLLGVFTLLLLSVSVTFGQTLLEQADSLYDLRAHGFDAAQLLADVTPINNAIEMYQQALQADDGANKEEITWKLIRAIYFKGRYTTKDSEMKKKIYDEGKNIGEAALKELPNSAGINLYTAIVWGVWGEEYGILKAAKEGVAGKIKDYCERSIDADPAFDEAGGYRVLGRVYFKAPKIWPILRWPSKSEAVKILEKGRELAPENLATQQFLAEALHAEDQKDRAVDMLEEILAVDDVREGIVEDAVLKDEVKGILADWQK